MTDVPPQPRRRLRRALFVAAVAIAALVLMLYELRRTIAREALIGWLKARGIASDATIDAIGLGGLIGRIRIGDAATPDFTAANVEAAYGFRGLSLEIRSVTLKKPILRARLRGGQLIMGSLDPLIAELRKRPPRPDAAKPRIRIEDGMLLLTTDYGPVRMNADVVVENGKLMSLAAATTPARLRGRAFSTGLGRGTVIVTTRGARSDVRLDLPIHDFAAGHARLSGGRLNLTASVPYPDLVKQRGDGAFTAAGRLNAARVAVGDQTLDAAELTTGFAGQVTGWITTLSVAGKGTANLLAASGHVGGGRSSRLKASLTTEDLRWTRQGGDRVAATLRTTATGERFALGDLTLQQLALAGQGPLAADAKGVRLALGGSALGRGSWSGLGPPTAADGPQVAAVKRAARGFRFTAPAVQLAVGPTISARLVQPLTVRPDGGGEARLVMTSGEAGRFTATGGGLPEVDAAFDHARFADARASANLSLQTALSFGPMQDGRIDAAGRVTLAEGTLAFTASRCAAFKAARLDFGENDVEALSGRLCQAGGPLLTATGGAWRVAGRAEAASADLPFLEARLRDGAGRFAFNGRGDRFAGDAAITAARVSDAAAEPRFNPLAMTGVAELAADVWTADLAFAMPAGPRVATALLRHEVVTGKGGVDISTGRLVFSEGGLQPAQLSPLAEALGAPATGEANFSGGFAWAGEAGFSAGVLKIPRLDFTSPAGRVTGLSGEIALTSLVPLLAKPGQHLHAERLDALVPLTNLTASLEINHEVLRITGGEAAVEGGRVLIESLDVPMTPDAGMHGVLRFEAVQLKNVVEASPFASWMDMDARVSGKVPFEVTDGKVRITSGNLQAVAPGRLTIRRELFTGGAAQVQTDIKAEAVPTPAVADPNQTFTDMAYQAMEDLAFDEMGATVNSLPSGRLGVLFHIKGRHDPPEKKQIRLSALDVIRQRFLGKPLPLPSGTQVNLTLDTTLNLDDLLADYAEFNRTRGSAKVQP